MEQYYLILQSSVQNLNYDLVTDIIKCIVNMTSYTVKTCRTQSLLSFKTDMYREKSRTQSLH